MSDLVRKFKETFPDCWVKDGVEFNGSDSTLLWTGEGSMVDGIPMFNYNRDDETYVLGVHHKVYNWMLDRGLFFQAHDPGTYLAYE